MKKYPKLDIRVTEMKTKDIKQALQSGEIDAGVVASLAGMEEFRQTSLFYEQFFAYVAREDALYNNKVIRTSDLNGEQLWLLDEGHCFRDQLVRFCQPACLSFRQHGDFHAHGGKRQRRHLHSRAGCIAVEQTTERTGTPLCHPLPHPPDCDADQQEPYPPYSAGNAVQRDTMRCAQRDAIFEGNPNHDITQTIGKYFKI